MLFYGTILLLNHILYFGFMCLYEQFLYSQSMVKTEKDWYLTI